MKNYIGAIFTFLYLGAYLMVGPWSSTIDLYISGFLLLLTGIPHGAGDHLIAKKIADRLHLSFHLKPFIIYLQSREFPFNTLCIIFLIKVFLGFW